MDVCTQDYSKDIFIQDTPKPHPEYATPSTNDEPTLQIAWKDPQISLCVEPQTLKFIGYIKHHKVIVLIDSGNTHNFIHKRVVEENHCFVFSIPIFQIVIANSGMMMKCGVLSSLYIIFK